MTIWQFLYSKYSLIPWSLSSPSFLPFSENIIRKLLVGLTECMPLTITWYFMLLLYLVLVPIPQRGVTRAEVHPARFSAALTNISRSSFYSKIKGLITSLITWLGDTSNRNRILYFIREDVDKLGLPTWMQFLG